MIIIIQAIHLQQYACLSVETFRRHIKCLQDKLKIFNGMVYFLDQRSHKASSNGLLSICPPVYIRQHPWRITIVRCPNPSVKSCHKLSGSVVQIQPWLLCQFNRELCLASYAQSSVPWELNQVNLDLFQHLYFWHSQVMDHNLWWLRIGGHRSQLGIPESELLDKNKKVLDDQISQLQDKITEIEYDLNLAV